MFKQLTIITFSIFLFFGFLNTVQAGSPLNVQLEAKIGNQSLKAAGPSYKVTGADADVSSVVASAIQTVLGLLGMIFVILTLYAGFLWMTAGGEEEKVNDAISILRNAIIGLIIVIAAYAITAFVFSSVGAGGGSGSGPSASAN